MVSHSSQNVSGNNSCNSQFTWHLRLGHPNKNTMKLVLSQCNIPLSNKVDSMFCSACCMGKAYRLHSPQSQTQYHTPLELIFSDLWGPAPVKSSQNFTYYISFVDAYTRFTWIYMLKTKSEALTIFKQFKTMAECFPFKSVQTDWGGEFRPFTKFLSDLGIIHRLICPHTHHQNGVVERKHRHIVDLGLTLLSHASLPLKFWDHAFLTAVYLLNCLPTMSLNHNIPYTVLFNQNPNYKFLRVFGCACFPFSPL